MAILNNLKIPDSARASRPRSSVIKEQPKLFSFLDIFKAQKFCMGFLRGYFFGPGSFWGSDFGPTRSFLSLEIRSTSPRDYMGTCRRKGAVFQVLSPSIGCLKRQGLNC